MVQFLAYHVDKNDGSRDSMADDIQSLIKNSKLKATQNKLEKWQL